MTYIDLRHDFFPVFAFVSWNALLVNVLPPAERLRSWPKTQEAYCFLVDLMSFFALNFRRRLPSLDLPLFYRFQDVCAPPVHTWSCLSRRKALLVLALALATAPPSPLAQQALPDAPEPQRFSVAAGIGGRYRRNNNGTTVLDA